MQRRGYGNLGQGRPAARGTGDPSALHGLGRPLDLERLNELIKKTRYSVSQLRLGHLGREPLGDLEPAPIDQVSSVGGEKFVQHFESLRAFQSLLCALAYTRRALSADREGTPCGSPSHPGLKHFLETAVVGVGGSPFASGFHGKGSKPGLLHEVARCAERGWPVNRRLEPCLVPSMIFCV
jgi:hypothetical protein